MKRAILLLLLVLMVGCKSRLNDESSFDVTAAKPVAKEVPAITSSQKVNVSAKVTGGQIDIYFFLKKDQNAVEDNLAKAGPKLLASKLKATEADLSATIPANEAAIVLIHSSDGKKADVNLKISN